jgi:hypothetical protein
MKDFESENIHSSTVNRSNSHFDLNSQFTNSSSSFFQNNNNHTNNSSMNYNNNSNVSPNIHYHNNNNMGPLTTTLMTTTTTPSSSNNSSSSSFGSQSSQSIAYNITNFNNQPTPSYVSNAQGTITSSSTTVPNILSHSSNQNQHRYLNISDALQEKKRNEDIGWVGDLSREHCEKLLKELPFGTFLTRWSSGSQSYVVSYSLGPNSPSSQVAHIAFIKPIGNGRIVVEREDGGKKEYDTLSDYVYVIQKSGIITNPIHFDAPIRITVEPNL